MRVHSGEQLHESKKALKFGLKIIAHMKLLADKMKQQESMRLVLEQTPAESTAYRSRSSTSAATLPPPVGR